MRKVIITGGSKGLGKAIKERLEIMSNIIISKPPDYLNIAGGYQVTDFSRTEGFDLTTKEDIECAIWEIEQIKPDILILNAGVWKNNWRLNYESPKELAEQMPKDKLVIFVLSNAAYQSYGNDDYTAAKSGLLHYARRKQREGYQFATIAPGTIDTDFWEGAEIDNRKKGAMQPEVVAELVYQIIKAWENGALVKELIVTPK